MRTTHLVAIAVASGAACSQEPAGAVRIDVSSVWSAALVNEAEVDAIRVTVTGADFDPIDQMVPTDAEEASFERVPAGANRVFTVEASSASVPVFWGRSIVDVPAGESTVEVVVDPAGRLSVDVLDLSGQRFVERATFIIEPLDSNAFGVERRLEVFGGAGALTLVAGDYRVRPAADTNLPLVNSGTLAISQGQVSEVQLTLNVFDDIQNDNIGPIGNGNQNDNGSVINANDNGVPTNDNQSNFNGNKNSSLGNANSNMNVNDNANLNVNTNDINANVNVNLNDNTNDVFVATRPAEDLAIAAPVRIRNGSANPAVAVGDFDGDSLDEIVTLAADVQQLQIFAPDGFGRFALSSSRIFAGASVYPGLEVADIDASGTLDVVGIVDNVVLVFLGNGDGTFAPPLPTPTPLSSSTSGLAIARVNNDEFYDIGMTQPGLERAVVRFGVGDGSFGPPVELSTGPGVQDLVFGRFDADGEVDVVLAVANSLQVWRGNGDSFLLANSFFTADDFVTRMEILEEDNLLGGVTLVGASMTGIVVFPGDADGSFDPPMASTVELGAPIVDLVVADLDDDAVRDVLAVNEIRDELVPLYLNGDFSFEVERAATVVDFPQVAAVGNFDGYRGLDWVAGSEGSDDLAVVFASEVSRVPLSGRRIATPSDSLQDLKLLDVDNNGSLDVVVAGGPSSINVHLHSGLSTFQTPTTVSGTGLPLELAVGDLNGDLIEDLASANGAFGVNIYAGQAGGMLNNGEPVSTGGDNPVGLAIADIDGFDGNDLVVVEPSTSTVRVLFNFGDSVFVPSTEVPSGVDTVAVALADLDANGSIDAVTASQGDGSINVHRNSGGVLGARESYPVAGLGPAVIALAPLDGDEAPDAITLNRGSGSVCVLLNDGAGSFSAIAEYNVGSAPADLALGDVNGDTLTDLLVVTDARAELLVYFGDGDGEFDLAYTLVTGEIPRAIEFQDVTGDGLNDVVVSNGGPLGTFQVFDGRELP